MGNNKTHLFVYGTLTSAHAAPPHRLLARAGRCIGQGSVAGLLFDLGAYPGLVLTEHPEARKRVHGEIWRLLAPRQVLPRLDAYEGCGAGEPEPHLFERRLVAVRLESGRELEAWVYVYNGDVAHLRPIPGGRWQGPAGPRR